MSKVLLAKQKAKYCRDSPILQHSCMYILGLNQMPCCVGNSTIDGATVHTNLNPMQVFLRKKETGQW